MLKNEALAIQSLLDRKSKWLWFPAGYEAEFVKDRNLLAANNARNNVIPLALLYVAVGTLFLLQIPVNQLESWPFQHFFVGVCISIYSILNLSKRFDDWYEYYTGLCGAPIIISTIVWPYYFDSELLRAVISGSTIYIIISLYLSLGLGIIPCTVICIIGGVISLLYLHLFTIPVDWVIFNQTYVGAILIGLFAGYIQEYSNRKNYLQSQLLRNQNNQKEMFAREMEKAHMEISDIVDSISGVLWEKYNLKTSDFSYISSHIYALLGYSRKDNVDKNQLILDNIHKDDAKEIREIILGNKEINEVIPLFYRMVKKNGEVIHIKNIITPIKESKDLTTYRGVILDISDYKVMEAQLNQALKLESVGQLAAGIAHEINTPAQFVGDNIRFIRDSYEDINGLIQLYMEFTTEFESSEIKLNDTTEKKLDLIKEHIETIDLEYLREDIPSAISQIIEGIERISSIVLAMKEFSHPGSDQKEKIDLNQAIQSTVTVARNEWKYCANVVTHYDEELPMVECLVGEINQCILNLITNAAHAITEKHKNQNIDSLGIIDIKTWTDEENAVIQVSDTGTGIKKKHLKKIFDPFFTTKDVGKGTGQGLSIAHSVIVDKHKGRFDVESEIGKGTTFTISIPIEANKI